MVSEVGGSLFSDSVFALIFALIESSETKKNIFLLFLSVICCCSSAFAALMQKIEHGYTHKDLAEQITSSNFIFTVDCYDSRPNKRYSIG